MKKQVRCSWAGDTQIYIDYHDNEWGRPVHDDIKLFEMLILEGAQAGLSWITILKKREAYRKAFDGFDPKKVALYGDAKIEELMNNKGIIRNRLKINATITNAKLFLEVAEKYGSFDNVRDNGYDIDAPESFQLELLKKDLTNLAEGKNIKAPRYIPNGTGVSIPESFDVTSDKLIVVEGIATMYEDVKDVFDLKIYIETSNEIRRERFMKRAIEERNQTEENALKQWDYIVNAGIKYVQPGRNYADFVLDGNVNLQYFDKILEYIHAITNNFQ